MTPPFGKLFAKFWKNVQNQTAIGGVLAMYELAAEDGETIAGLSVPVDRHDYARFVVTACNWHSQLVEELEFARRIYAMQAELMLNSLRRRQLGRDGQDPELSRIIVSFEANRKQALDRIDETLKNVRAVA